MPGNMSKEDAPSRSTCLTFTIDNILNLRPQGSGDLDCSNGQKDGGCKNVLEEREDVWDVRRTEETGNSAGYTKYHICKFHRKKGNFRLINLFRSTTIKIQINLNKTRSKFKLLVGKCKSACRTSLSVWFTGMLLSLFAGVFTFAFTAAPKHILSLRSQ